MADKVKWERWGFLIVEEGTHTIVADCRYKDPTSTIEKWKHNRDEDVNKHEAMVQEILDSHNVGIATMRLLESLTPRGSEFHNDPKRCVEWVRERLSGVIKQVIKRKEAEAEVERLQEACTNVLPLLERGHADEECGCSLCERTRQFRAALSPTMRPTPSPEEWWAAYHTESCTCRQVPVEDTIFVGGQDDCPVHGFGTSDESTTSS